jgi:ABC-type multidrug transport system ATPase subunit
MDFMHDKLSDFDLVVFSGVSGSGKSTSIRKVLAEHSDYQDVPYQSIDGNPVDWKKVDPTINMIVIDEVVNAYDFWQLIKLLSRKHHIIVASHLPEFYIKTLSRVWRCQYICVDSDYRKICHYLNSNNIIHTNSAVEEFSSVFGANFIDTHIILEQYPNCSFNEAWDRFKRNSRIDYDMPGHRY